MSKQFPKKSKTIYTNAGFGVDEVSKETLETNMNILKGIAQEQENKIELLKEELEKVTKIADVVCAFYGAMYNDDPDDYYNNEFALQKHKELKEILK